MTTPLVLLDLDGTLMDSAPGITSSAAHAFRALGLPVPDAATLRSFVGPPITDSFPAHGVPRERVGEAVAAYRSAFTAGGMFDNAVFDGVPEVLRSLRAAGCTLAVATSKPEMFAQPICDRFGLTGLVDAVHGAPPDEARSTKADVIAAALDGLGRRPPGDASGGLTGWPVLMVGDREHDVHGAAEHGIDCLGVSWGYAAPGELETAGAVELVDAVPDLTDAVLRRLGLVRA
ncbi:HAD hydrolase-like protein [Isoptericola aurantiacus]|uniref:HAD hydrolase-like protein n=1 Tax=Isoptericola aurantiacus TaxID=3377839 RepID=UPI00383B3824